MRYHLKMIMPYLIAMSLIGGSALSAYLVAEKSPGEFTRSTRSFYGVIEAIATLASLSGFIIGFFHFAWWVPLVSIPISLIGGLLISVLYSATFAPLALLTGIGLAIWVFL